MIEPNHSQLSIMRQCDLLSLPRASYYRNTDWAYESEENLNFMQLIDEEYTRHPFYGSRKMRDYLRRQGHSINRKRVQRLMRKMGIRSLAPSPNTSLRNIEHKVYPYLLNGLDITRANQVWCTDITYIRLSGGFVYLVAVMDWFSRRVLSWEVSASMDDSFCVSALERALRLYPKPDIFNTDQGSQFTGKAFTGVLKEHDIRISMDGKGRCMDNIFIERLWRSVKYEEIYLNDYATTEILRKALQKYFHFYNTERPHQTFNSATPLEVYQQSIGEMKKETKKAEPPKACALADDSDYNGQIEKQSILNY
jgi:putative transposase|tara:strand:- start:78 stop:1004 length:927 start_codon:yes stop_codon:yes gene_type:complete